MTFNHLSLAIRLIILIVYRIEVKQLRFDKYKQKNITTYKAKVKAIMPDQSNIISEAIIKIMKIE